MKDTLKLKYAKVQNQIKIDDGTDQMGVVYYSLIILTLTNAALNLLRESYIWLWSILGLIASCFLIYYLKKVSFKKNIPVEKIKSFQAEDIFGKKRYFLQLESGRKRFLNDLNTLEKIDQAYNFFKSMNIPRILNEQ